MIFIILGVSALGLSCLFALKMFERDGAKFLPTLRAHADRIAMRAAAQYRAIAWHDIRRKFVSRSRTMLTLASVRAVVFLRTFHALSCEHARRLLAFVRGHGIRTPLTKGSVSLFLQQLSARQRQKEKDSNSRINDSPSDVSSRA